MVANVSSSGARLGAAPGIPEPYFLGDIQFTTDQDTVRGAVDIGQERADLAVVNTPQRPGVLTLHVGSLPALAPSPAPHQHPRHHPQRRDQLLPADILRLPRRDQQPRQPAQVPGHHRQHRQLRAPRAARIRSATQTAEPQIALRDLPGRVTRPARRIRRQVRGAQLPHRSFKTVRPGSQPIRSAVTDIAGYTCSSSRFRGWTASTIDRGACAGDVCRCITSDSEEPTRNSYNHAALRPGLPSRLAV